MTITAGVAFLNLFFLCFNYATKHSVKLFWYHKAYLKLKVFKIAVLFV